MKASSILLSSIVRGRLSKFQLLSTVHRQSTVITILFLISVTGFANKAHAQVSSYRNGQLEYSQQFRLADGIVRIAEPGQIADTVNVWGDVNNPGRYMIPKGTTVPELISYARGPYEYRTRQTTIDWSKLRIEVHVSHHIINNGKNKIANFTYRYNEPVPNKMQNFVLHNNDVVSLQVKARPSIVNYLQIIAPVITSIATTLLIINRL